MLYLIFSFSIIAIIALIKPRLGLYLILLILPAYLIRFEWWGIPTTFLELSIYIIFLAWLLQALLHKKLMRKISRLYRVARPFLAPVLIFFAAACIATLISPEQRISLGVLKGWFFDPLLVLILFLDTVRTAKQVRSIILSLFLAAAWVSTYGLYEYMRGVGLDSDGRLNSVYIPANYVGMFVAPILILAFALIPKMQSRLLRGVGASLFVIITLAIYASQSYGAWLGILVALVFLWFRLRPPFRRLKYLLIFALLVVVVSLVQSHSVKFGNLFTFTYRTSSAARFEIWRTAILIIREHPLLGIGLGNFEAVYREYVPQIAFPPLEWLVVKPHNLYLNLWIEMGLLGLASFIWLVVAFFKRGIKFLDNPIAQYTLAAMITLLAHGLVDTPYFKNDLSILFWVLIGLVLVLENKKERILDTKNKKL